MSSVNEVLNDLKESVETWNRKLAIDAADRAKAMGISPFVAIEAGLGRGMTSICERFHDGKIYLPQVLAASQTMQEAMERLDSSIQSDGLGKGLIVLGTVQGDIHEIGKNVIKAFLRGGGYTVIDLGKDVSPEDFVKIAREREADVVGGSALMTTTLICQKQIVDALDEEGLSSVKTIFGGAPCNQDWVIQIGGDGYCACASGVIDLVRRLLNE